jgi:hypothetical protein
VRSGTTASAAVLPGGPAVLPPGPIFLFPRFVLAFPLWFESFLGVLYVYNTDKLPQQRIINAKRRRHQGLDIFPTTIFRCEPFFLSRNLTYWTSSVILRGIARVECLSSKYWRVCIVRELGTSKREGIIVKKQKSKKKQKGEKRKESSGAKSHLL